MELFSEKSMLANWESKLLSQYPSPLQEISAKLFLSRVHVM